MSKADRLKAAAREREAIRLAACAARTPAALAERRQKRKAAQAARARVAEDERVLYLPRLERERGRKESAWHRDPCGIEAKHFKAKDGSAGCPSLCRETRRI